MYKENQDQGLSAFNIYLLIIHMDPGKSFSEHSLQSTWQSTCLGNRIHIHHQIQRVNNSKIHKDAYIYTYPSVAAVVAAAVSSWQNSSEWQAASAAAAAAAVAAAAVAGTEAHDAWPLVDCAQASGLFAVRHTPWPNEVKSLASGLSAVRHTPRPNEIKSLASGLSAVRHTPRPNEVKSLASGLSAVRRTPRPNEVKSLASGLFAVRHTPRPCGVNWGQSEVKLSSVLWFDSCQKHTKNRHS